MLEMVGPSNLMAKLNSMPEIESATPTLQLARPQAVTPAPAPSGAANPLNGPGTYYQKYQWDIKQVTNNGESFLIRFGSHDPDRRPR
jgi:lantibiotic leader peptide-processing serine protease